MTYATNAVPRDPPLLMDTWARGKIETGIVDPVVVAHVAARMRVAHRFVLTDAATRRVGALIRGEPRMLVEAFPGVRAPYDVIWLEFPHPPFLESLGETPDDLTGDLRVGFLVDHGIVYGFSYRDSGVMLAHRWHLHRQDAGMMRTAIHVIGGALEKPGEADEYMAALMYTSPTLERLRAAGAKPYVDHALEFIIGPALNSMPLTEYEKLLRHCAGDPRNVLTLLHILSHPSLIRLGEATGFRRTFSAGKACVLPSWRTVDIPVDPAPLLRPAHTPRETPSERAHPSAHDVRGHWRHDAAGRGPCDTSGIPGHSWGRADAATPATRQCCPCGARRWWISAHRRGDESRGAVAKIYRVVDQGARHHAQ